MATTTLTTSPDTGEDREPVDQSPIYHVTLLAHPGQPITARLDAHYVQAWLQIGPPVGPSVSILADSHTGPDADLDTLETFLRSGLTAVTAARADLARHRLTELPCGGVCHPATWNNDSTWACTAVDGEHVCGRETGHDGAHVACTATVHNVHTWPKVV